MAKKRKSRVQYIFCTVCGMRSYHPQDIANGYCGKCHNYTNGEVGEEEVEQ